MWWMMNIILAKYQPSYDSLQNIHLDDKLDRVVNSGRFWCERMHLCLSIWWCHKAEGNKCRRQWVQKTTSTEGNEGSRHTCSLLITWLFFGCGPEIFHTNPNCICCKLCMADDNKWCYIVQSIRAFMNWNATLYFSSSS